MAIYSPSIYNFTCLKKYRQRIFEKLDVRNISEAIITATNNKLSKKYHMDRDELKKLYNTPGNLRLKRIALCVIGVAIAILISMIFLVDIISWQLWYFMCGCAGLLAIIFVVLAGILVFRVNSAYIEGDRRNKK